MRRSDPPGRGNAGWLIAMLRDVLGAAHRTPVLLRRRPGEAEVHHAHTARRSGRCQADPPSPRPRHRAEEPEDACLRCSCEGVKRHFAHGHGVRVGHLFDRATLLE